MTTQHPEALRLAEMLEDRYALGNTAQYAAAELRRQHARITELEAQLSAIGAGGVSPLRQINQPEPTVPDQTQDWAGMDGATAYLLIQRHADNWADVAKMMGEWLTANQRQSFDAADVATAAAQGFRDGVASVSAGSEPVAGIYQLRPPASAHDTITEVINELRTYNPQADAYGGKFIHKGWANQLEAVAPPQISESDADYWVRNRALILRAIEERGFRLVSSGGLFWLSGPADGESNV